MPQFSIPKPKGGKNSSDLILREDQRERLQALARARYKCNREEHLDVFAPEYGGTSDPFSMHKLSQIMYQTSATVGYGRKNPNEAHRRIHKKRSHK
jgi:hypothetical protein